MKVLITLLILFAFSATGYSQENSVIYLSQAKIVSNKDYPVNLKDSIREIMCNLNMLDAEAIVRKSLILKVDSAFLDADFDSTLKMNIYFKIPDSLISVSKSRNIQTTTYAAHMETRPLCIPYNDIKYIRLVKRNDYYAINFVTKPFSIKDPPFGGNKLIFKIIPEAKETSLIASLLYLCTNIKDSGLLNF